MKKPEVRPEAGCGLVGAILCIALAATIAFLSIGVSLMLDQSSPWESLF